MNLNCKNALVRQVQHEDQCRVDKRGPQQYPTLMVILTRH